MRTHLLDRLQNGGATDLIQAIGRLVHAFLLRFRAPRIRFEQRAAADVMRTVDRSELIAVQMTPVAHKRD